MGWLGSFGCPSDPVVVDEQHITRPPDDPEDIYREAVTVAIREAVARWPHMEVYLDKR